MNTIKKNTEYLSKSRLDLIAKSPYLYWWKYLSGQYVEPEPTPALTFGKALHCRLLEPEHFGKRYAILPPNIDRRTKEGKEKYQNFIDETQGMTIITREQDDHIEGMHRAIMSHEIASSIVVAEGESEITIDYEYLGYKWKSIIDRYSSFRHIIWDLKTTDDASPEGFRRSMYKYRYHIQAALYMEGMRSLGYDVQAFVFLAIEKNPPYQIGLYYISQDLVNQALQQIQADVEKYQHCCDKNSWPMYENIITEIK